MPENSCPPLLKGIPVPPPPVPTVELPCRHVDDNVDVLLDKLKTLRDSLQFVVPLGGPKVFLSAEYDAHGKWVWGKMNEAGVLEKGYFVTKDERGYIYSFDDCLLLKGKINELIEQINSMSRDEAREVQKQRVIHKVFDAIRVPTKENCQNLYKLANQVEGHGNKWAQVAIVLTSIALLIAGILPGVLFIAYVHSEKLWSESNRRGLAAAVDSVAQTIEKTEAPNCLLGKRSFFTSPRRVPATATVNITTAQAGEDEEPTPTPTSLIATATATAPPAKTAQ